MCFKNITNILIFEAKVFIIENIKEYYIAFCLQANTI